jgi:hypothetical protein
VGSADPGVVPAVVAALAALEPTAAEREQARAGLLVALPTAAPWEVAGLVASLRSVSPVGSWIDWLASSA